MPQVCASGEFGWREAEGRIGGGRIFAATRADDGVQSVWANRDDDVFDVGGDEKRGSICGAHPIGRPIANTQVYILDGMERAGAGGGGGRDVYRRRGSGAWVSEPAGVDGGAVCGGSVRSASQGHGCTRQGIWGDGWRRETIEFLGRNDFQVKIRGFRIELGEIEARLLEQRGSAGSGGGWREDAPGDKRLVAYYTTRSEEVEGSVGAEELRRHLSAKLPEYMVPAAYVRLE